MAVSFRVDPPVFRWKKLTCLARAVAVGEVQTDWGFQNGRRKMH